MITYDPENKVMFMDLVDLEHCGFDHNEFAAELNIVGVEDKWPIALIVNFAGGHAVIPGVTKESVIEVRQVANLEFEALVQRLKGDKEVGIDPDKMGRAIAQAISVDDIERLGAAIARNLTTEQIEAIADAIAQATGGEACPYCGSVDGCKPVGGLLAQINELSADDWRKVYEFIKYVQLPFIHQVIYEARSRDEE